MKRSDMVEELKDALDYVFDANIKYNESVADSLLQIMENRGMLPSLRKRTEACDWSDHEVIHINNSNYYYRWDEEGEDGSN